MASGTDIIAGAALIDNLIFADGMEHESIPGGAGLYALAGAALFSDDVLLVTGTGEDLPVTFGPWMDRNRLSKHGLRFADPHAPRNILRYIDEHTRTETPIFGHEHFRRIEPTSADIGKVLAGARSAYVFRNTDPGFWDGMLELKQHQNLVLLWEIGLDACSPRERPAIERLLEHVDALSLNLDEAALIFETRLEEQLISHLQALPVPRVFLRAGRRGSFAITQGSERFIPSLLAQPVDVTGGGNAYSGAALVGLAEGKSLDTAAAMGTVAASLAIEQFGPHEPRDPAVRLKAETALRELITRISEGPDA
jgi:sugar/nucleoside kinase (ribokinase family)